MGGRLDVGFKSRSKLGFFLRSYIYSERGKFAASFYNTNSILMFFPKWSILGRGGGGGGGPYKKQIKLYKIEKQSFKLNQKYKIKYLSDLISASSIVSDN